MVKKVKPLSKAVTGDKYALLVQFIYCLPCIVYTAVVILIFRAYLIKNMTYGEFWSNNSEYLFDLSNWCKTRLVIISAIVALCILIWRIFTNSLTIKKSILYIPMAVYVIAVILSFAFSKYKNIAWSGNNERFEGTYMLVCYMFMLFYTINTIDNQKKLKIILCAVIISQLLLQIIGIAQFTGHNPLESVIGQKLIFPNNNPKLVQQMKIPDGQTVWQIIDKLAQEKPPLTLLTNPTGQVYQTVYNINNASFYLCVIIPLFTMLFILSSDKKQKIVMAIMFTLTFINICATNSSGGFLGLFAAFIAAVITFRKSIIKWRYQLLIIIALAGASFVSTNLYVKYKNQGSRGTLVDQIGRKMTEAVSTDAAAKDRIDYFVTNNDSIDMSVNNNQLKIKISNNADSAIEEITDDQNKKLDLEYRDEIISFGSNAYQTLAITIADNRFSNVEIFIPELTGYPENIKMYVIRLKSEEAGWSFLVNPDGIHCVTNHGVLVKLHKVPRWGFKNKQHFGSNRGYIWSRTFPLMPDTLFLGHGADTFIMYFPHNDFVGLYYDWYDNFLIVDKPHNFILLNFVNTGGISVIALMAILIIYLIQGYKLYSKNIQWNIYSKTGAGIYLGIIAFIAAGMVYDTSVDIMPLIYGLFGIGISCNYLVKADSA